jgi:ABC-2 type transport system permease protein
VWAVLVRDARLALSYRLDFLLRLVSTFFSVVLWYFFAAYLTPKAGLPGGTDYFAFVVVGTSLLGFLQVALHGFAQKLREDQMAGTLEMLFAAPAPPFLLLLASCLWALLLQAVQAAVGLGVASALGARFSFGSPVALAAVLLLTLACFAALGVLAASLLLVFQRGEPVTPFVGALFTLLGGVFFPVAVLPAPLAAAARLLPLPYATDALRKVLLDGAGLAAVQGDLWALLLFAAILTPLSAIAFSLCLRLARRYGLLGLY